MLERPRKHPKREKGSPTLLHPIPGEPLLSSRDKKQVHWPMPLRSMRNKVKHTKDTRNLFRPLRQIPTHSTEPSPNDVEKQVHSNWTIQLIKNDRGSVNASCACASPSSWPPAASPAPPQVGGLRQRGPPRLSWPPAVRAGQLLPRPAPQSQMLQLRQRPQ